MPVETVITKKEFTRRDVAKIMVASAAGVAAYNMMPVKWNTPIIEQIFLPAHAATSGITGQYGAASNVTNHQKQDDIKEMIAELGETISDFLVSDANAQVAAEIRNPYVFITATTVTYKFQYGYIYFSCGNSLECQALSGSASSDTFSATGSFQNGSVNFTFTILSLTEERVVFTITHGGQVETFTRLRDSSAYSCQDEQPVC